MSEPRPADRRRRPSGDADPRTGQVQRNGWIWLTVTVVVALVGLITVSWPDLYNHVVDAERDVADSVQLGSGDSPDLARLIFSLGSNEVLSVLRLALIVALVVAGRWRHLAALVAALFAASIAVQVLLDPSLIPLSGAAGVDSLSYSAAPAAGLAITLVAAGYSLLPSGSRRNIFFVLSGVAVIAVEVAGFLLGLVSSPGTLSLLLAVSVTVVVMQYVAPEDVFPIEAKAGGGAHLDLGPRIEGIKRAVEDQLGLLLLEVKPVGSSYSAGSTPMRLLVDDGDGRSHWVFAKLFSTRHLRSDQVFKLYRTIRYGSLEDERSFESVRRLVEYEDYMMQVLERSGLPGVHSYGVVELVREREYALVSDFLDGSTELTDAEVTDELIAQGFDLVRRLWQAGVAHRDLKPANMMVLDGTLHLVDVSFGSVRPSAWRQSVDLADMVLTFVVLTGDPDRVLAAARQVFDDDELAEALATADPVTLPSQIQNLLADFRSGRDGAAGRDLLDELRQALPQRATVRVQRWTARRVLLGLGVLAAALGALAVLIGSIDSSYFL